ncbi:MAG: class I SAM-dependent methyltransferase [Smithellaceae bacterium]|jgi:ubiquinone/menaquinone biosynthesis C-methylase UbiE
MSADIEINTKKRNFDQEAAKWDQVPGRVKVAQDIAQSMIQEITLTPDMDVLDFGCGTGLLTFALQPFVHSITGVDSSQGMVDVFKTKIKEQNLSNVKANYLDLDKGDVLEGSYHLIASSMTLHHIKNISPLLKQFYSLLLPSGQLAIADLDLDDGQFHGNNDGVFHFSFDRKDLQRIFIEAGFRNVRHRAAAQIEKPTGGGQPRLFTMFLMTGRK